MQPLIGFFRPCTCYLQCHGRSWRLTFSIYSIICLTILSLHVKRACLPLDDAAPALKFLYGQCFQEQYMNALPKALATFTRACEAIASLKSSTSRETWLLTGPSHKHIACRFVPRFQGFPDLSTPGLTLRCPSSLPICSNSVTEDFIAPSDVQVRLPPHPCSRVRSVTNGYSSCQPMHVVL